MLANKVQVVQVAAHVVPQPAAATVQHCAILLAVIVVGLIFAPGGFQNDITCGNGINGESEWKGIIIVGELVTWSNLIILLTVQTPCKTSFNLCKVSHPYLRCISVQILFFTFSYCLHYENFLTNCVSFVLTEQMYC